VREHRYGRYLCSIWSQLTADLPASADLDASLAQVRSALKCTP